MNDTPDKPPVEENHGEVVSHWWKRISLAWIFPIIAATAAFWLFWSDWSSRGPEIEITFNTAPGLQAGKTPLIYRGVTAGVISGISFDENLEHVVVRVRLKAFAKELARQETIFWIDQPEVSLNQISGLDAIVQGNTIYARQGGGPFTTSFVGRSEAPLEPLEAPSLVLRLRAPQLPRVARGAPVYYRGIRVGSVNNIQLDAQGEPYLELVIDERFAGIVHSNTRFWPVPGASAKAGPGGLSFTVQGLASLIQGGIEFDNFGPPGDKVPDEKEFWMFVNEAAAVATSPPIEIIFSEGAGLTAGTTKLSYLGMPVGMVESVQADLASGHVKVTARFDPAFDSLRNENTIFCLIKPRISLHGISGLDTFLSGVYIDCIPGNPGKPAERFIGKNHPPSEFFGTGRQAGLHITVSAKTMPPIGKGAPVMYRGLRVGSVKNKILDSDNNPVLEIAIHKDYENTIRSNSRFWTIPATSIVAGPGVLEFDIGSLETLLEGGLAFDTFGKSEERATEGAQFQLSSSESAARCTSPPVRISFPEGQGLLAGQTQLRFLGVPVGLVEEVIPKKDRVDVVARFHEGYDMLRRAGSSFSVVRPKLSMDGISGLQTLISGVYIDCAPGQGEIVESFDSKPLEETEWQEEEIIQKGLEVIVSTRETTISPGAPIFYRGLQVGKVTRKALSDNGQDIDLYMEIQPEYAPLIRENTKFWNAGGLKATLGFFWIKVQSEPLSSLTLGGIAFATPNDAQMGARVKTGHRFELYKTPRREWLKWSPSIKLPSE